MTCPASRSSMCGRLTLALLPLLLAACTFPLGAPPSTPEQRAQQSLLEACRQRADEAYNITHRGDIYAPESQVNTPFSADYQPGVPSRGLSVLYQRDQMVSDCVRNTGAEGSRTPSGTELPSGTIVSPRAPAPSDAGTSPGTLPLPPPPVPQH
ncbi:MAG TPA: hypothetical protein VMU81_06715 [Acetobacteraceae bacterium]|jgi:hypothetical protein|nr:hypothetical protein [Acetobacteraceae bacterium]